MSVKQSKALLHISNKSPSCHKEFVAIPSFLCTKIYSPINAGKSWAQYSTMVIQKKCYDYYQMLQNSRVEKGGQMPSVMLVNKNCLYASRAACSENEDSQVFDIRWRLDSSWANASQLILLHKHTPMHTHTLKHSLKWLPSQHADLLHNRLRKNFLVGGGGKTL